MARILLVDDDPLVRETLRQGLESDGHTVIEAPDGEEALAAFDTHAVDLVITDIVMPGREGLETIMALRRREPDVNIIAISGGSGANGIDYLSLARKFGARNVLSKPFRKNEILAAVNEALGCGDA